MTPLGVFSARNEYRLRLGRGWRVGEKNHQFPVCVSSSKPCAGGVSDSLEMIEDHGITRVAASRGLSTQLPFWATRVTVSPNAISTGGKSERTVIL